MKLRPAQSVLHFRCHDVNVNIDGALWAYRYLFFQRYIKVCTHVIFVFLTTMQREHVATRNQ